ncbi:MAG TPA: hypothetical protein PK006_06260 [Saprospiraceae bacterium]|nr:hypothetical protein [Saprospiraceae bacterium]
MKNAIIIATATIIFCFSLVAQNTVENLFTSDNAVYVNRTSAVNSNGKFYTACTRDKSVLLMEMDQNNWVSRIKKYAFKNMNLVREIYVDVDDNIYIAGYSSILNRLFVLKLNPNLDVVWSNFYGPIDRYYLGGMSVNSSGKINLVGIDSYQSIDPSAFSAVISADGTLINYSKIYVRGYVDEVLYSTTPNGNSGFILVGSAGNSNGSTKYPLWIASIDADGNKLWSRYWEQSETDFDRGLIGVTVVPFENNTFILSGRKGDDRNGLASNYKEINSILVHFNQNGTILNFKEYLSGPNIFNYAFATTYDGKNIYFAGSNGLIGQGAFIAKLDKNFEVIHALSRYGGSMFFSDVDASSSRLLFSGARHNSTMIYDYWFINTEPSLNNLCGFESIDLTAKNYTPIEIYPNEEINSFIQQDPLVLNLVEDFCFTADEFICPNAGVSSVLLNLKLGKMKVSILGLDTVYCNTDQLISLIGKGSPSGGKFYLNGVEVSSFNPGLLNPNITYTLKYYNGAPDLCNETAYHNFTVLAKPSFQINAQNGCVGEQILVTLAGNPHAVNYNFDWDGGRLISGTGNGPFEIIYDEPGVKNIKVSGITPGCGTIENNLKIQISELKISLTQDTSLVKGSYIDLKVVPLNGQNHTYKWTPTNDLTCSNCPNPRATPKSTTKYKVIVTDNETGCTAMGCVNIRTSCCK